jgi:voltage-gated potassium channel
VKKLKRPPRRGKRKTSFPSHRGRTAQPNQVDRRSRASYRNDTHSRCDAANHPSTTSFNQMSHNPPSGTREPLTTLQLVTLLLSIYVLITLVVQTVIPLEPEVHAFLDRIDFYVCLVFLTDFFIRLYRAPSKSAFLAWGWIDFVSSIPMFEALRVGRLVRLIRILRILRAFRSTKSVLDYLLHDRKTSLSGVAAISFMLVVFSSIAVLHFEASPEANIKTPVDAFWWAYVTITTVGYGDKFPLSLEGRIVACVLMTAGVGLFGTFTGFVASIFVDPGKKDEESEFQHLTREIQLLREQVQTLASRLDGDSRNT